MSRVEDADGRQDLDANVPGRAGGVRNRVGGATTVEIPSSHVAMVSYPAEVADLVEKAAAAVTAAVH